MNETPPRFGPMTGDDITALLIVIMVLSGPPGWLILLLCAPFWAISAALKPKAKACAAARFTNDAPASPPLRVVPERSWEERAMEAFEHGWKLP